MWVRTDYSNCIAYLFPFVVPYERVEKFKYLGITLTDQNSIAEEINSRFRSASASFHSVQNLVFQVAIQKFKDQDI